MNVVKDADLDSNTGKVEQSTETARTLKRMERAWLSILRNEGISKGIVADSGHRGLIDKAKQHSIDEGEGMSIFKFLRPRNDALSVSLAARLDCNCEYYYAEKDSAPWSMMIQSLEDAKEDFLAAYGAATFAICISIPEHEAGDSTVQQIKLFSLVDNKEVPY